MIFGRTFYASSLILSVTLVVVVGLLFDLVTAIKGSYIVFAILISAILYASRTTSDHCISHFNELPRRLPLAGSLMIASLAISLTVVLRDRNIVILTIPILYLLLAIAVLRRDSATYEVLSVCSLTLFIQTVSKYLLTGFYFGNGDLIMHSTFVESVIRTGTTSSLLGGYQNFPGYHILAAMIGQIVDLSGYDSILVLGVLIYSFGFPALVFVLYRRVFREKHMAQCITAIFAILTTTSFYANYFFPQSLALVVLLFFIHISVRARQDGGLRWHGLSATTALALLVIHHLTILLFLPILAGFLLLQLSSRRISGDIVRPAVVPSVLFLFLSPILYWYLVGSHFIKAITWASTQVIHNLIKRIVEPLHQAMSSTDQAPQTTTPSSAQQPPDTSAAKSVANHQSEFYYGVTPPARTIDSAFESLLTVDALYYVALAALVLSGLYAILAERKRYQSGAILVLVGIASAALVLKTPISFKSMDRFRHFFSPFFAIVCGIGISYFRSRGQTTEVVLVALLVVAGTTGAVLSADELYGLHNGRELQHEFTSGEVLQLNEVGNFVDQYGQEADPTTAWITHEYLSHHGADTDQNARPRETGIHTDRGLFIYRDKWTHHKVAVANPGSIRLQTFHVSKEWLRQTVSRQNKIYDSGRTGILWTDQARVLNATSDRTTV